MKAFLSHTSSDKDLVGLVHQKLENQNAWYDAYRFEIVQIGKCFAFAV